MPEEAEIQLFLAHLPRPEKSLGKEDISSSLLNVLSLLVWFFFTFS